MIAAIITIVAAWLTGPGLSGVRAAGLIMRHNEARQEGKVCDGCDAATVVGFSIGGLIGIAMFSFAIYRICRAFNGLTFKWPEDRVVFSPRDEAQKRYVGALHGTWACTPTSAAYVYYRQALVRGERMTLSGKVGGRGYHTLDSDSDSSIGSSRGRGPAAISMDLVVSECPDTYPGRLFLADNGSFVIKSEMESLCEGGSNEIEFHLYGGKQTYLFQRK